MSPGTNLEAIEHPILLPTEVERMDGKAARSKRLPNASAAMTLKVLSRVPCQLLTLPAASSCMAGSF